MRHLTNNRIKVVVLIQASIIVILTVIVLVRLDKKKHAVISKIDKSSVVLSASDSSTLKYYYEPAPNTIEEEPVPGYPDKKAHYHINGDTLNSLTEYTVSDKPVANTLRIIALGDSFTFGLFVDTDKNYPTILEKLLNERCGLENKKYEVINLGVGGFDIQTAVERYRRRGLKYNPNLVLWYINYTDVDQIREEIWKLAEHFEALGIPNYDEKTGKYVAINKAVNEYNLNHTQEETAKKQVQYMKEIRNYFRGKILIITDGPNSKVDSVVNSFMAWDSGNSVRTDYHGDKSNLLLDGHQNERGNAKLANDIFTFITTNGLINCGSN